MCAPAVVALVGAAVSAKQQMDAAEYQAGVDENNARISGYRRDDAIQRGAYDARRVEIEGKTASEALRSQIEGGGISSTSGSAANAIATSRINAAADAARLRSNAAREAWGFANEEQDLRATSKFRKQAGYMGALGTGLSGVGQASSYYAQSKSKAG